MTSPAAPKSIVNKHPTVLICECAFQRRLPPDLFETLQSSLSDKDAAVVLVNDLCMLVAQRDERLLELIRSVHQ